MERQRLKKLDGPSKSDYFKKIKMEFFLKIYRNGCFSNRFKRPISKEFRNTLNSTKLKFIFLEK